MIGLPDPDEPRASALCDASVGVGGGVPPKPRLATRPLLVCCWPLAKPLVPDCDELPLADSRSMLELADVPEPGASSSDAVSDAPELPMNMSVRTFAICRASPYL